MSCSSGAVFAGPRRQFIIISRPHPVATAIITFPDVCTDNCVRLTDMVMQNTEAEKPTHGKSLCDGEIYVENDDARTETCRRLNRTRRIAQHASYITVKTICN